MKVLFASLIALMLFTTSLAYADTTVEVGKQVAITADVSNSLDRMLEFAYITQIKNHDDIVISLSWLSGTLSPNQSFSPAQSWTPEKPGTYYVEVFVWEDVDNPSALSPPLKMTINAIDPGV